MRIGTSLAVLSPILLAVGCAQAPMAPTVQFVPGYSKTSAAFSDDMAACRTYADQQITVARSAVNTQIIGNVITDPTTGAQSAQTARATLQQPYDAAYSQCMYAKGNTLPGAMAQPAIAEPRRRLIRRPVQGAPGQAPASGEFVEPAPAATPTAASGGFAVPPPSAGGGGFAEPPPAAH